MHNANKEIVDIPLKQHPGTSKRPPLDYLAELYDSHTAKEIAEMFEVSESTVRSWVARARKRYKAYYAAMEEAARKKGTE